MAGSARLRHMREFMDKMYPGISRCATHVCILREALNKIADMDPKAQRADDLGRAAIIAREALQDADGVTAPALSDVPNDPACTCGSASPRAYEHALSCPHSTPWDDRVKARLAAGSAGVPGVTTPRTTCDGGTCGVGGYCDECPAVANGVQRVEGPKR